MIGLLKENDIIKINLNQKEINAELTTGEIEKRKKNWKPPAPKYTRGVLAKYAKLVSSAAKGAVTS